MTLSPKILKNPKILAKNFLKRKLRKRNVSSLNWRLISASDRNDLRASNLIESSIFTAHLSYPCQSVTPTNNVHIATRAPINKYISNPCSLLIRSPR